MPAEWIEPFRRRQDAGGEDCTKDGEGVSGEAWKMLRKERKGSKGRKRRACHSEGAKRPKNLPIALIRQIPRP